MRSNDAGDLVVTKGDQYDVREAGDGREVRIPWFSRTQLNLPALSKSHVILAVLVSSVWEDEMLGSST